MASPPPEAWDVALAALGEAFQRRHEGITYGGPGLCTTPRLASGNPNKVAVMCIAASSSASGIFAYSNSNNGDDATLKMLVPSGK